MPTPLPVNPFSTLASETRVGAAAGPILADPSVPAADNFLRIERILTEVLALPPIIPFDDVDPIAPLFLRAPRREFLRAAELCGGRK
jgi:hypothetical protein